MLSLTSSADGFIEMFELLVENACHTLSSEYLSEVVVVYLVFVLLLFYFILLLKEPKLNCLPVWVLSADTVWYHESIHV